MATIIMLSKLKNALYEYYGDGLPFGFGFWFGSFYMMLLLLLCKGFLRRVYVLLFIWLDFYCLNIYELELIR
jgi:hypothetical protein